MALDMILFSFYYIHPASLDIALDWGSLFENLMQIHQHLLKFLKINHKGIGDVSAKINITTWRASEKFGPVLS